MHVICNTHHFTPTTTPLSHEQVEVRELFGRLDLNVSWGAGYCLAHTVPLPELHTSDTPQENIESHEKENPKEPFNIKNVDKIKYYMSMGYFYKSEEKRGGPKIEIQKMLNQESLEMRWGLLL